MNGFAKQSNISKMMDYLSATVFWIFLWRVRKTWGNSAGFLKKEVLSLDLIIAQIREESQMIPSNPLIRILISCHLECHSRYNLHRYDERALEISKVILALEKSHENLTNEMNLILNSLYNAYEDILFPVTSLWFSKQVIN